MAPTPDFVLDIRRHIGHDPLPLVGVTAVVFRDEKVLLGRRADNGNLECVSGIVEPGEHPADAAVRECLEEAGIDIRVTRLALVHTLARTTYANGDQVDYLDLVFRCEWVSGDPHPADGEMTEVAWHALEDLGGTTKDHLRSIALALAEDDPARFEGGRPAKRARTA